MSFTKRRIFFLLVAAVVVGIGALIVVSYFFAGPNFEFSETPLSGCDRYHFTYVGDGDVTVSRYLMNGRAGDPGCDSSALSVPLVYRGEPDCDNQRPPDHLPLVLRTGDMVTVNSSHCANKVVSLVIFTDKGTVDWFKN